MALVRSAPSGPSVAVPDGLTVPTVAARNALPNSLRTPGMLVTVAALLCTYELASDLVTWVFVDSSPALASQPAWFVDPSGSDDNDGTEGAPLLTTTELNRRLWPFGRKQLLTSDVTAYLNTKAPGPAVVYQQLTPNVSTDEPLLSGFGVQYAFNIIVGKVSSAPLTLGQNAVIPIASTNQAGQLAVTAGSFVDDELIEFTTGPAAGAVCYSNGLNGDAQHTFVTGLTIPTIAGSLVNGGHGQDLKPLAGDACTVTTLCTQVTRLEITCTGFARVFVRYAKISRLSINGSTINAATGGVGGPVFVSCCQQISTAGRWETTVGGATLLQCRTPRTGKTALFGTGWLLIGHAVQGTLCLNGQAESVGLNVDGGQLRVGCGEDFNHPGQAVPSKWLAFASYTNLFSGGNGGAIEFSRGALAGGGIGNAPLFVCEDSEFQNVDNNGYMWGGSGTAPFAFGCTCMANALCTQGNVAPGVVAALWKIPSTTNLVIDNLFFAFSDNTIALKNSRSGLIGASYNVANNYNETDAGFYRTAQAANVGATAFSQIKKPGLYRVMGYVAVTTADAAATGTPVLNVTWTDDSGVAQTRAVATGPALTTLGGQGGQQIIECGPALALVSWSITGVGSVGGAKFSVRMRVEKDCFGP